MQRHTNSFGDLVMRHRGMRICIMGGGPMLGSDLEQVKADVYISTNGHGVSLQKPDYVLSMDSIHTVSNRPMIEHIRKLTDAPIIGPWPLADYFMLKWPNEPAKMLSGVVAMWVAYLMGAHPIILAGFDCYGGDKKRIGQHRQMAAHAKAEVRVVSGPLLDLYPAYRPNEKRKGYAAPDMLSLSDLTGEEIVVQIRKAVTVRGQEWPVGTKLRVARHEVRHQLKHKSLIEIPMEAAA